MARSWIRLVPFVTALAVVTGLTWSSPPSRAEEPAVSVSIDPSSFSSRQIYHSPQTPGYTAWTGSWIAPDNSLVTAFTQSTGPIASPPNRDHSQLTNTIEYLRSTNGGDSFSQWREDVIKTPNGSNAHPIPFSPQATTQLADGTLIRRVNGEDLTGVDSSYRGTAFLQKLAPATVANPDPEWSAPQYLRDPDTTTYQVSRIQYLHDGLLVATGQEWATPAGTRDGSKPFGSATNPAPRPLLMVSSDDGATWTNGLKFDLANEPYVYPNEWDVAELANGDLLAVLRSRKLTAVGQPPTTETTQVRNQAVLRRSAASGDSNPTWTMRDVRAAPFPHSGHPELLATKEGVVLHIAAGPTGKSVIDYTADGGDTWRPLATPAVTKATIYYPTSVQGDDGTIYIFGHVGADDSYGAKDESISLERFKLNVAGGTDPEPPATDPGTGAYAERVLARQSLISYWRLGEASGATAADTAGSRDGTFQNGVTRSQAGALPGDADDAAGFDGVDDGVSLPALPQATDFTVEGWQKLGAAAVSNNTLYGQPGTLRVLPRPAGFYVGVWLGGIEYVIQASTAANTGVWVHWAVVRSGTTLTVYRNGVAVGSKTGLPASAPASLSGSIGRYGNTYVARGSIDEVAVYGSALSASDLAGDVVAAAAPGTDPDPPADPPPPVTPPPVTPPPVTPPPPTSPLAPVAPAPTKTYPARSLQVYTWSTTASLVVKPLSLVKVWVAPKGDATGGRGCAATTAITGTMGGLSFPSCAVPADGSQIYVVKAVAPIGYFPWTYDGGEQEVKVTSTTNSYVNFFFAR